MFKIPYEHIILNSKITQILSMVIGRSHILYKICKEITLLL